jgi:hypothetical protein
VPRRLLLGGAMAALLLGLTAPVAGAFPPTHGPVDAEFDSTATGVCSFPISVHIKVVGHYTQFFDTSGDLTTKWIEQDVEQDAFTANGKTLDGEPFNLVSEFRFDSSGNLVSYYAMGGVERVPLPDGTMFWSAGRFEWTGHPGVSFTLTPDNGRSGNVEAFCAALS